MVKGHWEACIKWNDCFNHGERVGCRSRSSLRKGHFRDCPAFGPTVLIGDSGKQLYRINLI